MPGMLEEDQTTVRSDTIIQLPRLIEAGNGVLASRQDEDRDVGRNPADHRDRRYLVQIGEQGLRTTFPWVFWGFLGFSWKIQDIHMMLRK